MPVAPILGAVGTAASLGMAGAAMANSAEERKAAQQQNEERLQLAGENQKRALQAAKITGNILSQDYINNVLAPSLGYGAKQPEGAKDVSAFNPLSNKGYTPITPEMTPGTVTKAVTPLTPGITPGVVKKPRGM